MTSVQISYPAGVTWSPSRTNNSGFGSPSEVVQLDEVPCLPHWKDYDEEDGNVPTDWSARFDTSNWRIFSAWSGEKGRDTECERARLPLLRVLWIRTPPCCGRCIPGTPR